MHSIALVNQKGGVGKSTTAVNLSAGLAKLGRRVLLIDLDPQAHATVALGLQPKKLGATIYSLLSGAASLKEVIRPISPGLSLIPSTINLAGGEAELTWQQNPHFILKKAMADLPEDQFDFAIVDSPPQLGFLNVNSLAWVRHVFIPLTCEFYALHGLSLLVETVERIQAKLNPMLEVSGVIACQYNARRALTRDVLADLEGHFPGKVMKSHIRVNVRLAEAPSYGMSIHDYAPTSSGARDYLNLARELLERLPAAASPEVEAELAAIAAQKAAEKGLAWTDSTEPVAPTWPAAEAPAAEAPAGEVAPSLEVPATAEAPAAPAPQVPAVEEPSAPASGEPAANAPVASPSIAEAPATCFPVPEPAARSVTQEALAQESPLAEAPVSSAGELPAETKVQEVAEAEVAVPTQAAPAPAAAATEETPIPTAPAIESAPEKAPVDPLAEIMADAASEIDVSMPKPAEVGRVAEPSSPMIVSAEELAAIAAPAASTEEHAQPQSAEPEPVAAHCDDQATRLGFDPYAESSAHLEADQRPVPALAEFVSPMPATPVSELRAAIESTAPVQPSPESTVKPVPSLPSVKAASLPFTERLQMAGLKPIVTSKPGAQAPAPEKKGLLKKLMPWKR